MNKNIPAFLLTPSLIPNGKPAISLMYIIKKGKSINYETTELKWQLITKTFRNYPISFNALLMKCCVEELAELSLNINTRFSQRNAGIDYDTF